MSNDNHPPVADMTEFHKLDLDSLYNMREWMRTAVEAKGAKVTGAGVGVDGLLGLADLDIEVEGYSFNLTIRPREKQA